VFITNFLGMWAPQIQAGDVVNGPYATASTAPIVDRDISAVAAKALLTDELVGRKIPLTGTQAFTNRSWLRSSARFLLARCAYQESRRTRAPRFLGLGFSPEFADAYIAFLEATVSKPAIVHARGGEEFSAGPPRRWPKALRPIAHCSPISKGTSHVGIPSTAVPQADEQVMMASRSSASRQARRWS